MIDHKKLTELTIRAYPSLQGLYLFGSYADGSATAQSDVDIALLLPHDLAKTTNNLWASDLAMQLGGVLLAPIDLVNLRQVSTVFQNEIINHSQRLYCADKSFCDQFEGLTLSLYQKLNEERADILDAIKINQRIIAK